MKTLKEFVQSEAQTLSVVSDSPELDAELLVLSVLQKDRSFLYAYPETLLDAEQFQKIEALILRRLNGEPMAYIVGHKEFWSLDFMVTKDVLVPRPETELLVECVLSVHTGEMRRPMHPEEMRRIVSKDSFSILDLGTGSGAIAIAIAKEKPGWHITATDFSEAALKVAKKNAEKHDVKNISFFQGLWFEALPLDVRFDLIVSNPPYIAENDIHLSQGDVRFEPRSALVSGADGLDDIHRIIEGAKHYLNVGGSLLLEHGFDQGSAVAEIFKKNGYTHIESRKDLLGHRRVMMGRQYTKEKNVRRHY